ncbi:hypothetical protein ARMGADRAFT_1016892 [Armillaria gallica]|uniref:Peptidase C14 caspase domain-containing protein n=1 Tax=Armillaria gallica TaxID=47427 RepID=A0A2H3DG02_ARMGA|nr:hypothetical protein ARMGADRAFT_1016892 [Armillaria gallica]
MNEIVYHGSTLIDTVGNLFSQQKTVLDVLNFLELHDVVSSRSVSEKVLKPYWSMGDDISQRTYQYICDKILCHMTLGFQDTWKLISFDNKPLQTVERSRFWAVLIGIDAYEWSPLRGCVSDVLLVEKYLKEEIGMLQERIQLLLGSQGASSEGSSLPSRTNIVDTLLSLVNNPQIEVGDNTIIYFGGHGSGYSPTEYHLGNTEDSHSLCSMNESIEVVHLIDRDTIDNSGLRINLIFQQISRSKGHRIAFFPDSCHSGSHVRCFPEPGTRTVPPLPRASLRRMLHMADENLSQYISYMSILESDWRLDMSSHVIMAACEEYQTAREAESETEYYRIFTRAVIDALKSENLSEESTY